MPQNSSNIDFTKNADGYTLKGGTTKRGLTLTGGDVTITGTGANTFTFPSASDTLVGRTSTDTMSNKTITFAAGTAGQAPLTLTSTATLETTPGGGEVNYDGKAFYACPAASSRGVLPAMYTATVQAATTLTNATGVQSVFAAANDALTVAAGTTYLFEAVYFVTSGTTTTHTTNVAFGGTATLTSIMYHYSSTTVTAAATPTAPVSGIIATAASTAINATNTLANVTIKLSGVVRVNAAGTFIPQVAYSAAPGAAGTVAVNSYFIMWPIGNGTVVAIGPWA